jgi:hypothetical protein
LKDKSIIDRKTGSHQNSEREKYHLTPVASSDGSTPRALRLAVVYENVDRQRSFRRQSMMALERRLTFQFFRSAKF